MVLSNMKKKQQKFNPYKKGGKHRCKTGWTLGDSAKAVTGLAALSVGVQAVRTLTDNS